MKKKTLNLSSKQFNKLINEIAQGKKEALEKFYLIYGKLIYSVAISVTKSTYLADEIVDDVLVKIWSNSPKIKNINNPNGWVYLVTLNCARDKFKTVKPCDKIYDLPQEDGNIENFITKDTFFSRISTLNEDEQQIMILRFIRDLSFKSIAKEINKSISTVSSIYYRALEKLKINLNKF